MEGREFDSLCDYNNAPVSGKSSKLHLGNDENAGSVPAGGTTISIHFMAELVYAGSVPSK